VKRHLLCLTVDTDPDGLSGKITNRETLQWEGLRQLQRLPDVCDSEPIGSIPITWFVRADGQLESMLGNASYLLEEFSTFWTKVRKLGHEVAWHPHLYRQTRRQEAAIIITNPVEAEDELERLWNQLKTDFPAVAFRHGEGWHTLETYAVVERLGFRCDSTAIPGRRGAKGHPMNWEGAPNQPYFPSQADLCRTGSERCLLEVPMNTWLVHAPYDSGPRVRYMNPAIHPNLFAQARRGWEDACNKISADLCIWVMIFHPDEVLGRQGADALYSRSTSDLCANLTSITQSLGRLGHDFQWMSLSAAAECWRTHQQALTA